MADNEDLEIQVVDYEILTPTWLGVLPIYMAALENPLRKASYSDSSRAAAREELRKMAGLADAHVLTVKAMVEPIKALKAALQEVEDAVDDPDRAMSAHERLCIAAQAIAMRW